MAVSAVLITYNEKELVLDCLYWLNSLKNLKEICIIDSFSTDGTWELIQNFLTSKTYKIKQQTFQNFGQQKNDCIAMAEEEWVLLIDADESYGYQMDRLLGDINQGLLSYYNAFRFITFHTFPDRKHHIDPQNLDPHVRLWRRTFCKYRGECHERLFDIRGRDMHKCRAIDICNINNTKDYREIVLLHHQRLKSVDSLTEKGKRWAELDMLSKSAQQKIIVNEKSWADNKRQLIGGSNTVYPIHRRFWSYCEH